MDGRKRVAAAIKDYIARERISREQFAFKTKLGKSTVDKLLIGLFSDRTCRSSRAIPSLALRSDAGDRPDDSRASPPAAAPALKPLDGPSIAVLPFANMSGDPEQDYLADGITEDIITALARLRWLFVIARNSSFVYKGKARTCGRSRATRGPLRPRRQRPDRGRAHPHHRPAHRRRDRQAHLGREIRPRAAGHLRGPGRHHRAASSPRSSRTSTRRRVPRLEPAAGQHRCLGARRPRHGHDQQGGAQAERGGAGTAAPRHRDGAELCAGPCPAELGRLVGGACATGYRTAATAIGRRRRMRTDALSFDPGDPWARMISGLCLSTAGQHDRALGELRAALDLNPSFALGHTALGWALLRAGRFDEAIAETGRALRLSPLDSFSGFYTSIHGLALLGARRFEEALPFLRASVAAFAEYPGHYNTLISCCGHLGLVDEAQEFIAVRNRIGPAAAPERAPREPRQVRASRRVHRRAQEGGRAGIGRPSLKPAHRRCRSPSRWRDAAPVPPFAHGRRRCSRPCRSRRRVPHG